MLWLTGDTDADALLSSEPLALLIGMVLDQQIPMERAFKAPYDLKERLGARSTPRPSPPCPPTTWPPSSPRSPRSTASPAPWPAGSRRSAPPSSTPTGATPPPSGRRPPTARQLLANVKALPGFGDQKARIFVALLGKQLGVRPPGWEKAAGAYGEAGSYRSVADIDSPEALAKVRQFKQQMKAEARAKLPNAG